VTDRMASALTAVALIEGAINHTEDETLALLPDNMYDTHVVLSSTVWCAYFMAGELARQLGTDRDTVLEALRQEIIERFKNYNPEENNNDD
jgi:hypothetical protein